MGWIFESYYLSPMISAISVIVAVIGLATGLLGSFYPPGSQAALGRARLVMDLGKILALLGIALAIRGHG